MPAAPPPTPESDAKLGSVPNQQTLILETQVPLSQSVIWRRQRDFYVQRGLKAWTEDLVPQFITNNPFIAEVYAHIVLSFLTDCPDLSAAEPLRILELGAGVGKFSYLLLRHLTALLRSRDIASEAFRYCMTDCSDAFPEAWRANDYFVEFVQSGILRFERFEVGSDIKSEFLQSQGPLVLIANYVFDSLPQDAFVIEHGTLFEALVTTTAQPQVGQVLSSLQLSYKNVVLQQERYEDQSWNQILEHYRSRFSFATVLFPSVALKTLQELQKLSDGRMLVLAADKGFAHEEEWSLTQGPPTLEFHTPNCFSQMVNFDAIGKYFRANGGEALLPEKHSSSLNICAFLQGRPDDRFPVTSTAYRETQGVVGLDDVFTLLAWLNAHMEEMTVPQVLSALRLTRWDPIALLRFFPILARQLSTVSIERNDLREAVMRTWANHYPVKASENEIAFDCGVILLELRFFDDALALFKTSQKIFGPSAATSYNLGLCHQGLGRPSEAVACMIEACDLDPGFKPAQNAREKLEAEHLRD
jgi:tetratricopeptide (TPR) repeat protein